MDERRKIVLIYPPVTKLERYSSKIGAAGGEQIPLGIFYVAAYLRNHGWNAQVIDAETEKLTAEQIVSRIRDFGARWIGISSTTVAFHRAIELATVIKKETPHPTDSGRRKRLMFGLGPATKIYIAIEPVDMRKGFDGLYGLVRDHLGQDPLSGHLFLFANRTHTRLKVLVWDGSGLWVCAKRLERGRFRWPVATDGNCLAMRSEQLALLLNGLDMAEARPRKDWLRRLPAA